MLFLKLRYHISNTSIVYNMYIMSIIYCQIAHNFHSVIYLNAVCVDGFLCFMCLFTEYLVLRKFFFSLIGT